MAETLIPVGRELDAAVAEKVMGWQRISDDEPFRLHNDRGGCITNHGPMKFRRNKDAVPFPWEPSTDMNDAMNVLCKARGDGDFSITSRLGEYACTLSGRNFLVSHYCSTISEAICRAALAAVEGKHDG